MTATDAKYKSVVEQLHTVDSIYLKKIQALIDYDLYDKERNISSITDLIYDRSDEAVRIAKKSIVDYADEAHISRAGYKGATLSITQKQ